MLASFSRVVFGFRTALAAAILVVATLALLPQTFELFLIRWEARGALARTAVVCVWLSLVLWHCCDAKLRSLALPLADPKEATIRRAMPLTVALAFLLGIVLTEIYAAFSLAALPREPIRLYPLLQMKSLGWITPGLGFPMLAGIVARTWRLRAWLIELRHLTARFHPLAARVVRSAPLFLGVHAALFLWGAVWPISFAWTIGTEATLLVGVSCWLTFLTYAQVHWRRTNRWLIGGAFAAAGMTRDRIAKSLMVDQGPIDARAERTPGDPANGKDVPVERWKAILHVTERSHGPIRGAQSAACGRDQEMGSCSSMRLRNS
jgi:hypothetical protein